MNTPLWLSSELGQGEQISCHIQPALPTTTHLARRRPSDPASRFANETPAGGWVQVARRDCPDREDLTLPDSPQLTEIARATFPGRAENVQQGRRFIADVLGRHWPRLDDVLTLASELASNAVRHTASGDGGHFDITVAVCAVGSRVRIQVTDQGGSSVPRPGEIGDDPVLFTGGRGLRIVEVLADRWGHDGDELGRVVWFEIAAKPETETAPT